ncbi:hypothetical protein TWF225_009232 [Orbilia oligospora]|nr:hypothetical protein TWF225_009232 [Orbilia oligospora]KAF3269863.1 hypothetical protein TWF217_008216 [Orbilia oligospora]KAF3270320.1 hypothetical protein TWF128_004107 [Orbilia oligospora]
MADLFTSATQQDSIITAIKAFIALPESVPDNTDYISFSNISAVNAHAIRSAFDNDPIFDAAYARFTYDPMFGQIRITRGSPLIDVTANWLQKQEKKWKENRAVQMFTYQNDILSYGGLELRTFTIDTIIKTPCFCLQPWSKPFPSVVVETGYTQPLVDLERDKEIWKNFTNGETKVVVITKFAMTARGTVMADVWFHRPHAANGISTSSRCTIFPAPRSSHTEVFFLDLSEVYGGECPEGVDPDRILELDLTELREMCREELRNNELVPDSDDR